MYVFYVVLYRRHSRPINLTPELYTTLSAFAHSSCLHRHFWEQLLGRCRVWQQEGCVFQRPRPWGTLACKVTCPRPRGGAEWFTSSDMWVLEEQQTLSSAFSLPVPQKRQTAVLHRPRRTSNHSECDTHHSLSTVSGHIPRTPTSSGKWATTWENTPRLSADTFAVVFDTKWYLTRPQNGNWIGCNLLNERICPLQLF